MCDPAKPILYIICGHPPSLKETGVRVDIAISLATRRGLYYTEGFSRTRPFHHIKWRSTDNKYTICSAAQEVAVKWYAYYLVHYRNSAVMNISSVSSLFVLWYWRWLGEVLYGGIKYSQNKVVNVVCCEI